MKHFKFFAFVSVSFIVACFCRKAPSAPASGTLDSDRERLYAAISQPYCLDGNSCNPLRTTGQSVAFAGGMKKVASSTDPFVSKLAQKASKRDAEYKAMYDESFRIQTGGGGVFEGLDKVVLDKINENTSIEVFEHLINSPMAVKTTVAGAINLETDARSIDDMVGAYEEILSDAKLHPRGASIDPRPFGLDFLVRGHQGQDEVRVVLHNETGRTLHNTLVVAVVKHDLKKVDPNVQQERARAKLVEQAGGAREEILNAQAASEKARDHLANNNRGFEIFIPEWREGQTVEVGLAGVGEVWRLLPGELSIISDEVSSIAIPVQPEKMSDALKHPQPPNPSELHQQEQDRAGQRESVQITKGDGVIIYRFQAYPHWSHETTEIKAPEDMKTLTVAWEPETDIQVAVNFIYGKDKYLEAAVNGHAIDGAKIGCRGGDTLDFRTVGNDPVGVAVRFLQREATAAEKDHLELRASPAESKRAPTAKEDEEIVRKQHQSVCVTAGNGVILYQFLAYPGIWSEAAVAPDNMKDIRVAWEDGAQLQMQVDNQDLDPKKAGCLPGSRLRFRAVGDKPVCVAVRFVTREYTAEDKGPFVMPTYPPANTATAPQRRAIRDAVIAFLRNGPAFAGTRETEKGSEPARAELAWDDELGMATGWISFPKQGNKKAVEGRIIDDLTSPPVLQLVETKGLETGPRGALIGLVYSLRLAPAGTLTGAWTYRANSLVKSGQVFNSGTLTIDANPPKGTSPASPPQIATTGPAVAGPAIVVRSPSQIQVAELKVGAARLYDSTPLRTIEGVADELRGFQFTSIPQRVDISYEVRVRKAGTLYVFGFRANRHVSPKDIFGTEASKWEAADASITGTNISGVFRRQVVPGDVVSIKWFEASIAAESIGKE